MRSYALITLLAVLLLVAPAYAQFFQSFFDQSGGGGHHHHESEAPPTGDANWFEARVEAATCKQYLCPRTLSCVPSPSHCPCPFPHQIRCPFPDGVTGKMEEGGHVCTQEADCERIRTMRKEGAKFSLKALKGLS